MATWNLTVDGVTLRVTVTRKRVKNVNARLRGSRLPVSAPHAMGDDELEPILHQLASRLVRRSRAADLNREGELLERARRVAARFEQPLEVTDVRLVTSASHRWGSYSARTGVVRLHAALARMPPWVLDAALAHELAHAVHPDHSEAFWRLLRRVCPETDRARAFLEGVAWTARGWEELPAVERSLLAEL